MYDIKPGSVVAYSAKFLRSICCYTGDLPFAVGEVLGVNEYGIAHVRWDRPNVPKHVNVVVLIPAEKIYQEPN